MCHIKKLYFFNKPYIKYKFLSTKKYENSYLIFSTFLKLKSMEKEKKLNFEGLKVEEFFYED